MKKKAPKRPELLSRPKDDTAVFGYKTKEEKKKRCNNITVDCPIAVKLHCFISSSESGSNLERCGTRLKPRMHAI